MGGGVCLCIVINGQGGYVRQFILFHFGYSFVSLCLFFSFPPASPTQHTPQQSGRGRPCTSRRRTTGSILMRRSKIIQSGDGGGDGGGGGGGRQVLGESGRRQSHHRMIQMKSKNRQNVVAANAPASAVTIRPMTTVSL